MFDNARLRLTAWYLLILTAIVGVLSIVLYRVLVHLQHLELQSISLPVRRGIVQIFARDEGTLALQIAAVDLGVLILGVLGAYVLAGRTLAPIRESMERQQRFAAAASHELRTPLTVLQGTMEVALLKHRSTEEYEMVLQDAAAEASRMGELIADLLSLARAEADHDVLRLATVDLRDVAEQSVSHLRLLAERKHQQLTMRIEQPLMVSGDRTKLQQALSNLVENAITYTPISGSILVSNRRDRGRAILQVRDTGPGIASDDLPHIFEPFYRVDAARSDPSHVGLGLALSYWIVKAHHGSLAAESKLGSGTVFTMNLPLASRTSD